MTIRLRPCIGLQPFVRICAVSLEMGFGLPQVTSTSNFPTPLLPFTIVMSAMSTTSNLREATTALRIPHMVPQSP
jgi:hypothetical protein